MSCRPVLRSLCVGALALVFGAAGALPASAAPALPSEMVTAMERDLGTGAGRAEQRVAREAAAGAAAERLRGRLGDSFSGAWVDPASGGLVVGTTDAARSGEIRAAGAQPVVQPTSERDLMKVQAKLDKAAHKAARTVGSWYIDPAANAVVVDTVSTPDGEAFVTEAQAQADPVEVRQVDGTPEMFADLVGGDAIRSAVGRCSIGFSARSSNGTAFVITAGHCTEGGGTWTGFNGAVIGPVAASSFPRDDYGSIRVDNTAAWTPTSQVAGTTSVLGSTEAAIGASVCRSGSTTGFRCGVLQAKNATVNYGGGDIVRGLVRTSACAEPGDSGGSFVAGRQAQGMTSGGSGSCSTGGTTFYQPVNEALSRYGLSLVTG